jgi:hypothetical protein
MANIEKLLIEKDNVEIIRDTIVAILLKDIENQKELAAEKLDNEIHNDFNIGVYVENTRPYDLLTDDNNPFPLVNICLQKMVQDERPGSSVDNQKYIVTFNIDCWACGNSNNKDLPDDYLSAIRAWKTARVVRNILMAGCYTYLGKKDIVRKREIKSIDTIIPQGMADSAISITVCRIIFNVETFEESPQVIPSIIGEVSFRVDDPNGKVNLVNINNVLKE